MASSTIIHAAGLMPPSIGLVKTWCGLRVGQDKLAVIGTRREVNCLRCAKVGVTKTWPPGCARHWRGVIRRRNAKVQ